jgi:hypothetical protein
MMSARAFAQQCAAYLALAALMLQLALSFDHLHKRDLGVAGISRADAVSVKHTRSGLQGAERLPARLADDDEYCPICFSSFLLSSSSLPDASVNPHPLDFAALDRPLSPVSDRVFLSRHRAFYSRAPPAA